MYNITNSKLLGFDFLSQQTSYTTQSKLVDESISMPDNIDKTIERLEQQNIIQPTNNRVDNELAGIVPPEIYEKVLQENQQRAANVTDIDYMLKVIQKLTEIAFYLQNYTFVYIYIPNFVMLLTEWSRNDRSIAPNPARFGKYMIESFLVSTQNTFDFKSTFSPQFDFDAYSQAPIAISDNDFILFTPYATISTNVNLHDAEFSQFDLNNTTYRTFNKINTSGDLTVTLYEFMHPIVTKYMSYYYSLINTIAKNSFLDIRKPYLRVLPYAYITVLTVTPDLRIPVAGITFLNCLLTSDPIRQLMSIQVAAQELKQIDLQFTFQTYRRFFLRDDKYKVYFEGNFDAINEPLFRDMFLPLTTIDKAEFLKKLQGYVNKPLSTNSNANNSTI